MKSMWTMIVIAALALSGLFIWSGPARQPVTDETRDVTVAQGIQGDLLTAGRNVDVGAQVDGDLAVAGARVTVSGPIEGYVLAVGEKVASNGPVDDDLWAAGANVTVSSAVGDNARLAGRTVIVEPKASIGRDALIAANRVEVRGPVKRDLKLAAAEALVAAEVGGSVWARTPNLKVLPDAVIHGDLVTYGPEPPEISSGAQILGQRQHHASSAGDDWRVMDRLFQWLFGFLALLVLGVTTVSATTLWSVRIANEIKHHFGFSILVGIIALALIPLLAMVLATTLIGLPLALVVFALLGAALLLSGVFVSLRIGSWIMDRAQRSSASPHARLATGALLLSFVAALPWIGWLAWVVVPIVGVGALVLERRDAWQQACAVRVT